MSMTYLQYATGTSYEETVYLRYALLVPHTIEHEQPATISRTEDGKLKVYKHSLAGSKKRIWHVQAYMTDSDSEGYCWSDLESFYWNTVGGPTKQLTFGDNAGQTYTVRVISFGPPEFQSSDLVRIRIVLEEDYS